MFGGSAIQELRLHVVRYYLAVIMFASEAWKFNVLVAQADGFSCKLLCKRATFQRGFSEAAKV